MSDNYNVHAIIVARNPFSSAVRFQRVSQLVIYSNYSLTPTFGIRQYTPTTCSAGPLRHCVRAFLSFVGMLQLLFDTLSGCISVLVSCPANWQLCTTTLLGNV